MGYLFYSDALGLQNLARRNPALAVSALRAIADEAAFCAEQYMPGTSTPIKAVDGTSLVVFNDSTFLYAEQLPGVIHFAAQLAYRLFTLPEHRGGPLGIRGTIIETTSVPIIESSASDAFLKASRLIVEDIGAVLAAEKARVLGARIIVPKRTVIDAGYSEWDIRIQARVMALSGFAEAYGSDVLALDDALSEYCDIAWMSVEDNDAYFRLADCVQRFSYLAAFGKRAALHAAATLALYRATDQRRRQLVVILRKLWAGARNTVDGETPSYKAAKKDDYSGWLRIGQEIRGLRDGSLEFPLDMSNPKALGR